MRGSRCSFVSVSSGTCTSLFVRCEAASPGQLCSLGLAAGSKILPSVRLVWRLHVGRCSGILKLVSYSNVRW